MYDRSTKTLWHSMTGEPVIGELANSGLKLKLLAVTLTTWSEWVQTNPDTDVLSQNTGFMFPYFNPENTLASYFEYFHSPDVVYPTLISDDRRGAKDRVFALRFFGAAAAYPIDIISREKVVNDVVGPQRVVIVANEESMAARAYDPMDHTFSPGASPSEVIDEGGAKWLVEEDALVLQDDPSITLRRLPGQVAFWFGWYAFHPHTELYAGAN